MPKRSGFTLIELLVAITIVAILSTIGLVIFQDSQKSARDAKRKSDITAISKALEQYKTKNGSYPLTSCGTTAGVSNTWSIDSCWDAAGFSLTNFIKELPKDPLNVNKLNCATTADCHLYHYCSDGSYYVLAVNLESGTDQGNPTNCPTGGPIRFWIPNQL